MNLIRTVLLVGGLFYGFIYLVELLEGHILWQALIGIGIIVFLSILPHAKDEHDVHQKEMIFLWFAILLFGLYAILKTGGIL